MRNSDPSAPSCRDHGGNLEAAIAQFGGTDWIDLSTGINPIAYPIPKLSTETWSRLPSKSSVARLEQVAAQYFGAETAGCLAVSGAQAAIQLMPLTCGGGKVAVLGPTYNEHAASFRTHGGEVVEVSEISQCPQDVTTLVIVNPNNPDGRVVSPGEILALKSRFETVIVDESFTDISPEISICSQLGVPGLLVLRSFGKFFGLAGMRLGFVLGNEAQINGLRELSGPWPVNGPAIEIGMQAYADDTWIRAARGRLRVDAARLDGMAVRAGWATLGGCDLFRLYDVPDAVSVQTNLGRCQIWSRIFPYSDRWLRLGLPGAEDDWKRLEAAMLRA